jgi:site-specific recombinase XerD
VTSYVSRHSFATVLKRSGVSTEFIKESLGHSNLATTEKYLAGFEDKEQRKNADILTQF